MPTTLIKPKPLNSVLLTVEQKYAEEIITANGLKLYLDSSFNPQDYVTVVGKVASLPSNPQGEGSEIISDLKEGDEVLFSYSVINDRKSAQDGMVFHSMYEQGGNEKVQRYMNGKGEYLNIKGVFQGIISTIWTGVYLDSRGQLIDGCQGSEAVVDRWKSQFSFTNEPKFQFKNLISTGDADYWNARFDNIFAKRVNGELQSVGNRLILEPIDLAIPEDVQTEMGIKIPSSAVVARVSDRATLLSGGEDLGFKKGDVIGFNKRFVETYDVEGKQYFLLKKRRVLGHWSPQNN